MTNAMIIENARIELMKAGIIGTTGRKLKVTDSEGKTFEVEEPEEIHTYQAWKSLGFQVQKGQKAVAQIRIWKHANKKEVIENSEGDSIEQISGKMFMTNASFFTKGQVQAI